ncbi:hypothetical protein LTR70_002316 [Exophiala xenobiotica]|uniref:Enoyl reductase (ER) domain-containing protein n=1 Tax=Lithohypha guttulata TaxID=1690604 RepID=A0ABR0KMS9_9EURO|nr:hypothetical protein LTR24_001262 [Lithohypha guttulata]KAK5326051.1 hypothetical protein LTR70_002316 [Exophiala xenobiotica]
MPKSISISKIDGKPGKVYYPLSLDEVEKQSPKNGEVVVKIHAAALNHRDLFIRQHLYPGTAFGVPLLADGCGTVVEVGSGVDSSWKGKRVVINPGEGWQDSLEGPEDKSGYKILGGTKTIPNGTLQELMVVKQSELEEAPAHLTDVEAAAIPLTGLTAWRAVMVKCGSQNIGPGKNVLITGVGGGVALASLAFAKAAGANVYVTSGSEEKIKKAKELGAKGGVNYKEEGWDKKLLGMLTTEKKQFDAIVDGAGGDIVGKGSRLLKNGGVLAVYGMTTGPSMPFLMQAVLKNIEVKGSTMGSRKEFTDMIDFIKSTKAKPVVSNVAHGLDLDAINGLFEEMKKGSQFGKLVVEVSSSKSKL